MIFSTGLTALPGVVHASDTCNIVGEDDLRPGETLVDQYRRLEGKRDHWSQEIELNQLEYRRVLDNPFEPEYDWTHELRRLNEIYETQKFYRKTARRSWMTWRRIRSWSSGRPSPALRPES